MRSAKRWIGVVLVLALMTAAGASLSAYDPCARSTGFQYSGNSTRGYAYITWGPNHYPHQHYVCSFLKQEWYPYQEWSGSWVVNPSGSATAWSYSPYVSNSYQPFTSLATFLCPND